MNDVQKRQVEVLETKLMQSVIQMAKFEEQV